MTATQRILILGGTSWLGGSMARIAHERGHEVTCLARGESGPVPDGVTLVKADRWEAGAYDRVAGQDWDAVIEVSWQPELVRSALTALADRANHWTYVSSGSVYSDDSTPGADERAETLEPWSGSGRVAIEEYGPAKVACEVACAAAIPAERLLIARAGLIAGYGDLSDRFGYWPGRFASANAKDAVVLLPSMESPVQVIDVQDLAGWLVSAPAAGTAGVFDAVGEALTFVDLVSACVTASEEDPACAVADSPWLLAQGVAPWMGPDSLPVWLPMPEGAGVLARRNAAATKAGLSIRSLGDTVQGALAWERELGLDRSPRKAGLRPEREAELITMLLSDAVDPAL